MEAFKRLVMPGTIPGEWSASGTKLAKPRADKVFLTIEWTGKRLSITGVVGPKANGDCYGSCGQCRDALKEITRFDDGWWMKEGVARLAETWDRWHLNDMRAGCEHQREMGWTYDEHPSEPCPTCGYKFGTAWRREDVPEDVLQWLHDLPETTYSYPWRY
jgi:hypothetical protein